jgi:hypothetical protein
MAKKSGAKGKAESKTAEVKETAPIPRADLTPPVTPTGRAGIRRLYKFNQLNKGDK